MNNPLVESCPLLIELDNSLVEGITIASLGVNKLRETRPDIAEQQIESLLIEADNALVKDHQKIKQKLSEVCIGKTVTGECCLVGLSDEQTQERFPGA